METLTAVIDDLHSGPRRGAEFHSALDKSSAALLCLSRPLRVPPSLDRGPHRLLHYSTNHASPGRSGAASFSSGRGTVSDRLSVHGEVSAELRDGVPSGVLRRWLDEGVGRTAPPVTTPEMSSLFLGLSHVCKEFTGISVSAYTGICTFLCSCARADPYSRALTRERRDRITNVLRGRAQALTTQQGDLLALFVRSVAVISRAPRRGRPAGSHLPRFLSLRRNLQGKRGGRIQLCAPPNLDSRCCRGHRAFPASSSFPLSLKMNDKLHY